MLRSLDDLLREFGRKRGDIYGTMIVYRQFKLPPIRHSAPFAKRKVGKQRREERRLVRRLKECNLQGELT
jgi:hypothetical protein